MRRGAVVIASSALLVVLTACSSYHPPSTTEADPARSGAPKPHQSPIATTANAICNAALTRHHVETASTTTVATIRAISGGHGLKPHALLPDAFRGTDGSAKAAWCWVPSGPARWTSYIATNGRAPIKIGVVDGDAQAPIGPYPFR